MEISPVRKLALVIHFHQPVGNLDSVVRSATERCYRPFLDTLERHPEMPMTLHYSGCLLEWLEANAPDVTEKIAALIERGQVELMTGGFYEPILAALPARDQVGQIKLLSDHLAERYGADATGLWLTERVWEQDVVAQIAHAGVRYTVIDDTIFHSVGITDDELTGPFVTEHSGKPLLVYAGDRRLRYLIPYKRVERTLEYLRAGEEGRLFVYADDGEKFGEWPGTYDHVYTNGWLEQLFGALETAGDVELTTVGLHAMAVRPVGRAYLPSSSYDEMMTWALPARARLTVGSARRALAKDDPAGLLPFVRGAPWRAFLAKYPEVDQLQKRMLHVSDAVHEAGAPEAAVRELYRAQCNCAYWHGAFGGFYLAFMRSALWHHLMRAESLLRRRPSVELVDIDADARDEVLITAPWGAAVLSVDDARVVELDDWRFGANLLAVTARHREAYHLADENPPEEGGSDDEMTAVHAHAELDRDTITFDDTPPGGCIDLIDGDRIGGPYEVEIDGPAVTFIRETETLRIVKRFTAMSPGLVCQRMIQNRSAATVRLRFGSETSVLPLNLGRGTPETEIVATDDGWHAFQPEAEVTLELKQHPRSGVEATAIETAAATLEGLQTMLQGSIVRSTWDLEIPPDGIADVSEALIPVVTPEGRTKKERGVSA